MLPDVIGSPSNDVPTIARYVNRAQQMLIGAGGETGFWGGWQKVVFNVSRCHPYITLPAQFARAINMDVCSFPIRIQNEFYEFLEAGIGLQDFYRGEQWRRGDWCGALQGFERGTWPTMVDLTPTNQFLRAYLTDVRDVGKRILFTPAKDQNGNYIYSTDGNANPNGFYLTLAQPFTDSSVGGKPMVVTEIGGIQKDITYGDVLLYQVDATTGVQVLLSRYGPTEMSPAYRRYYINRMPCGCFCHTRQSPCIQPQPVDPYVPVTAMCKLEHIPVAQLTDWMVIGNIPALIEECKAIRYSDMDNAGAAQMSANYHSKAIRLLNQEMTHYLGSLNPAVNFAPFGTAKTRYVMQAVKYG